MTNKELLLLICFCALQRGLPNLAEGFRRACDGCPSGSNMIEWTGFWADLELKENLDAERRQPNESEFSCGQYMVSE